MLPYFSSFSTIPTSSTTVLSNRQVPLDGYWWLVLGGYWPKEMTPLDRMIRAEWTAKQQPARFSPGRTPPPPGGSIKNLSVCDVSGRVQMAFYKLVSHFQIFTTLQFRLIVSHLTWTTKARPRGTTTMTAANEGQATHSRLTTESLSGEADAPPAEIQDFESKEIQREDETVQEVVHLAVAYDSKLPRSLQRVPPSEKIFGDDPYTAPVLRKKHTVSPYDWSPWKKRVVLWACCMAALFASLASSAYAPCKEHWCRNGTSAVLLCLWV